MFVYYLQEETESLTKCFNPRVSIFCSEREPIIYSTDMVNFPDLNMFLTHSLLTGQVELSMLKVKLIRMIKTVSQFQ